MPDSALLNHIRRFFLDYRPAAAGQTVVVAVSGGPDSVCLLHALHGLRGELDIRLHVAHLNHKLRGAESDADAGYVSGLAGRLGLPVTLGERDAGAYRAEHRLSPEEAAREVRYAFLAETAAAAGTPLVAVGHTAGDQAETVLMNLLRGTGTRGLRGLAPVSRREISGTGITVIRPLLGVARAETWDYCRRHRLEPRLDTTNLSVEPLRNRVRHRLIPALGEYNPKVVESLLRTARIAADDIAYIEAEAARQSGAVMSREKGSVIIDKLIFKELPAALQRQLLRSAIATVRGSLKDIEAGHIEDVLDALDKPAGKVIGLPDGLNFTIEYDRYVLAPDAAALCPLPVLGGEHRLNVPGTTVLPGWKVTATVRPAGPERESDEAAGGLTARLDYAATGGNLTVRSRRPGDRFRPLGMSGEKKLNEFMIDARIPRAWRGRVPVVASPERIVWVTGGRIDDRARVTEATGQVLYLRFIRTRAGA